MLRMILAMLIICVSSLPAVAPVSGTLGLVETAPAEGSITSIALEAASEPYTEAWLDKYAADKISFGEAYSSFLSEALPLENAIAGKERNGAVALRSLADGTVISFIFTDGRIAAVSPSP